MPDYSAAQNVRFNLDLQQLEFALGTDWTAVPASGGAPGGADTQIQFNDSGSFGGSDKLTWDGDRLTTTDVGVTGTVVSLDSNVGGLIMQSSNGNVETVDFQNNLGVEKATISKTLGSELYIADFEGGLTLNAGSHESVRCSTTGGVILEPMTTTNRDAIVSPAEGLIVYNTTTHALNFYNGSAWKEVAVV